MDTNTVTVANFDPTIIQKTVNIMASSYITMDKLQQNACMQNTNALQFTNT